MGTARVLLLAAMSVTPPEPARTTAPASWQLEWRAPAGCPAAEEVRRGVARTLRREQPAGPSLSVRGEIQQVTPSSWRLTLSIRDASGDGTRTIEAATCDELADAAALVIAIAIDPDALTGSDPAEHEPDAPEPAQPVTAEPEIPTPTPPIEPANAPPPEDTDEPDAPPTSSARSRPARARGANLGAALRVGGGLGRGILPAATPTIRVDLGLRGRVWRVDLGASHWFAQEALAPENNAVGGSFSLWDIHTRGCGVPGIDAFVFPVCLGLDLGAMRGQGTGALAIIERAYAFWAGAEVSVGVMWNWRVLGLWLDAGGLVSLVRPAFRTVQTPLVYEAGRFGGHLRAGLELRFP